MELRHLRAFRAVARTANFTRAAAELNYAQSSVTEQVRALEAELGTPLFDRTGRRIRLTPAGVQLVGYADRVLALVAEAEAAVAEHAGQPAGALAVGALETLAAHRLPGVLARFRADHPLVRVSVGQGNRGELYAAVRRGDLDLCLTFGAAPPDAALDSATLATDRLVVVAPPGHRVASLTPLRAADLAGEPFVVTERGCGFREMFDSALSGPDSPSAGGADGTGGTGGGPVVAAEVTSQAALCGCVAAGMGLALLPEMAVGGHVARGEVVALPLADGPFGTPVTATWLRRRGHRPAVAAFLATARAALAAPPADDTTGTP